MTRTVRTLLLSATAIGALATAAAAAPAPSPGPMTGMGSMGGMGGMHATGASPMHTDMADMAEMHAAMMADPAMQALMAEYGVDVEAMQADCPMLGGGSMGSMNRGGGDHLGHHGDTPGR